MTGQCRRCERPLRPYTRKADGHRGRGLCGSCWTWASRNGVRADYERRTRSRDDLLDDYVLLREQGCSWPQCAERLGMSYPSFARALLRARAAGDPRAGRIGEHWPPPRKALAS